MLDDLHALVSGGARQPPPEEPRSCGPIHEQMHYSGNYGSSITCNATFWKERWLLGSEISPGEESIATGKQ